MRTSQNLRRVYLLLMLLAGLFGLFYVLTSHLAFMTNAIRYDAINLTNISTAIFRMECVLLPAIFMMPRNGYFPKVILLKSLLVVLGLTCMAGVMWVFKYLSYVSLRDIFDPKLMYNYQGIHTNYIAINRFLWGNQGGDGVIFSLVLSLMYIVMGALAHKTRFTVAVGFTLIAAFRVGAPLVELVISGDKYMYIQWLDHNMFWTVSAFLFLVGLWIATRSDEVWLDLVWGEPLEEETDEDDDYIDNDEY